MIGVPCGTTICLTVGVTITGTSTVIIRPSGNFTFTLTTGFAPGVSVVGISPTSTISHPSGKPTFLITSSFVIGVPTSTTIGVTFGVTMIGTSTSTISPVGTLIFTLTLGFTPAGIVVGISPTSTISHPGSFGRSICPFTSSGVIGVPCGTTICLTVGVTMTGTSTVILRPSGNSTSTGTTGFAPGVSVVGISPTFVTFHPFGNSICFFTSSGVTGVPT